MPRPYQSPSSLALGANAHGGCEYAYALRYIEHIKTPEVDYADIASGKVRAVRSPRGPAECSYKARSAAVGKAMHHDPFEVWYHGGQPNWTYLPGQLATSGVHLLPAPSECGDLLLSEAGIGTTPTGCMDLSKPQTCFTLGSLRLAGNRDLLCSPPPAVMRRIGLAPLDLLLGDYKTTSSIAGYAKHPLELFVDVQANGYALDACTQFHVDMIQCRWVYFETAWMFARDGGVPHAKAVDFVITRESALEICEHWALIARRLDAIHTLADAVRNPDACFKYAGRAGAIGCEHHVSNGGQCDQRHTPGQLIRAANLFERHKQRKVEDMATEEQRKAFEAAKAAAAGNGAATASVPAAVAPPSADAPAAPARTRRRPAAQPPPAEDPEPIPEEPDDLSSPADIVELAAELVQLQKRTSEVKAAIAGLVS